MLGGADLDVIAIYDGINGLTSGAVYEKVIPWKNPGGDWVDADGVQQGLKPFAESVVNTGQTAPVAMDVTSLVQMGGDPSICLVAVSVTASSPQMSFNSRESGNGSVLKIDFADGSSATIPTLYDAESNPTTAYGQGSKTYLTVTNTVRSYIRFSTPIGTVAKATLVLQVNKIFTGGKLRVYKFALNRDPIPTETYSLKGDPRVFFETESFEDAPKYIHAPIFGDALHGIIDTYHQRSAVTTEDGGRALQVTFDPHVYSTLFASVCFPNFDEADEAAWEFDIRMMPDMLDGLQDGIKLFAGCSSSTKNDDAYFASWSGTNTPGRCGTLLAGNGGAKSHGYDGWSMRWDSWKSPPAPHPLHGRFTPMQYIYWPGQYDYFGDPVTWSLNGRSIVAGEWTTITQRAKINTCVGTNFQKDAELDGYINHHLAVRHRNFYLRTTDNPLIAQPPYNVRSKLAIGRIWINVYHGGTTLPLSRCSFQVRNFRAAKFA